MRRLLLSLFLVSFMGLLGLKAETTELPKEKITFKSDKTEQIRVDAKPIDGVTPQIDWGDGTLVNGEKNWQGLYAFKGTPKGTVTIYGACTMLDLSNFSAKNEITSVEFFNQTKLEDVNVKTNKLTAIDLSNLPALKKVEVGDNQLTVLDLSGLTNLEYATASKNKLVGLFFENNNKLKQVAVANNELSSLSFPAELPNLKSLDIEANAITTLDLTKVPNLTSLTITGNGFATLDVSVVPKLEKLFANGNYLTSIDLSRNTELLNISLNKNLLSVIDLSNNSNLTSVEVAENKLKSIDVTNISRLKTLNINKNEEIQHVDLRKNTYLKTLKADTTNIAGLDVTNNTNLEFVYIRGTRFFPASLTQFFKTMPAQWWTGYRPNIYLSYTSYKGADFSILEDKKLKTDLKEGTDTGVAVEPKDCKIDIDVKEGGTVALATSDGELTTPKTIKEGVLVYIDITPKKDYEVASIKAEIKNENGELVQLPITTTALVMEVDTKIIVTFRKEDKRKITLTTSAKKGTKASLTLRQEATSTTDKVFVDWGDGQKVAYDVTKAQDTQTPIDGVIAGENIIVYGAVNKLLASELSLTAVDFSENSSVVNLDLYGNDLTTVDLSNLKNLDILNLAMNSLTAIDLSKNTKLRSATLYGNSDVATLDVSANKELVELFAKNLGLTTIDLDLPKLEELDLHDNKLTSVDLTKTPKLKILRLGWNKFKTFGQGVKLPELKSLSIYHNELKEVDLVGFPVLEWLFINENPLKGLEIPKELTLINKINVADCSFDACTLNRLYKSLPVWQESQYGEDKEPVNLYNRGQGDKANDASGSKTSIATDKGWKVAAQGDGSGCNDSGIEELTRENGFDFYVENNICTIKLSPEYKNEEIRIYNISGQKVYRSSHSLEYRVELPKGAYIISIKGRIFKFAL